MLDSQTERPIANATVAIHSGARLQTDAKGVAQTELSPLEPTLLFVDHGDYVPRRTSFRAGTGAIGRIYLQKRSPASYATFEIDGSDQVIDVGNAKLAFKAGAYPKGTAVRVGVAEPKTIHVPHMLPLDGLTPIAVEQVQVTIGDDPWDAGPPPSKPVAVTMALSQEDFTAFAVLGGGVTLSEADSFLEVPRDQIKLDATNREVTFEVPHFSDVTITKNAEVTCQGGMPTLHWWETQTQVHEINHVEKGPATECTGNGEKPAVAVVRYKRQINNTASEGVTYTSSSTTGEATTKSGSGGFTFIVGSALKEETSSAENASELASLGLSGETVQVAAAEVIGKKECRRHFSCRGYMEVDLARTDRQVTESALPMTTLLPYSRQLEKEDQQQFDEVLKLYCSDPQRLAIMVEGDDRSARRRIWDALLRHGDWASSSGEPAENRELQRALARVPAKRSRIVSRDYRIIDSRMKVRLLPEERRCPSGHDEELVGQPVEWPAGSTVAPQCEGSHGEITAPITHFDKTLPEEDSIAYESDWFTSENGRTFKLRISHGKSHVGDIEEVGRTVACCPNDESTITYTTRRDLNVRFLAQSGWQQFTSTTEAETGTAKLVTPVISVSGEASHTKADTKATAEQIQKAVQSVFSDKEPNTISATATANDKDCQTVGLYGFPMQTTYWLSILERVSGTEKTRYRAPLHTSYFADVRAHSDTYRGHCDQEVHADSSSFACFAPSSVARGQMPEEHLDIQLSAAEGEIAEDFVTLPNHMLVTGVLENINGSGDLLFDRPTAASDGTEFYEEISKPQYALGASNVGKVVWEKVVGTGATCEHRDNGSVIQCHGRFARRDPPGASTVYRIRLRARNGAASLRLKLHTTNIGDANRQLDSDPEAHPLDVALDTDYSGYLYGNDRRDVYRVPQVPSYTGVRLTVADVKAKGVIDTSSNAPFLGSVGLTAFECSASGLPELGKARVARGPIKPGTTVELVTTKPTSVQAELGQGATAKKKYSFRITYFPVFQVKERDCVLGYVYEDAEKKWRGESSKNIEGLSFVSRPMAEEWVRNVTAVPDRCKDGATPPAKITVSIARGDVEKNAQGGFRPRWHLVDASGKPLAPGMDFLVQEKRTMRDDPNNVLDRRFKAQTQRGGVVTYDWHWPTARGHANLAWYSWTLLPVPRAPYRISPSTQARVGID